MNAFFDTIGQFGEDLLTGAGDIVTGAGAQIQANAAMNAANAQIQASNAQAQGQILALMQQREAAEREARKQVITWAGIGIVIAMVVLAIILLRK